MKNINGFIIFDDAEGDAIIKAQKHMQELLLDPQASNATFAPDTYFKPQNKEQKDLIAAMIEFGKSI